MKNKALLLGLSVFLFSLSQAGTALPGAEKKPVIAFTENKGQVHDQNYQSRFDVLYGAMTGNMAVHIKKTGVSYQLYRVDRFKEVQDFKTKEKRKEIDQQTIYRVDLKWINANTNFVCSQDETLPGYNNYYLESCPNGALNVKSYKGITLHNLYNGIDLHYYSKDGELKHDYIVAAHADYKQIQVKVEGAEISINEDGSLLLNTPFGKINEGRPIVYQNGKQLVSRWLVNNNTLSFDVDGYESKFELTIDPVTRLWGSYYGGTGDDYGYSTATDGLGNVYMGGYALTSTGTIIATVGSHQSVYVGGGSAYLAKFNSNGLRQWATYYGGSGGSSGLFCATDANNNVFLSGIAGSDAGTAIATLGSHQSTFGGGNIDAFLVKFDAAGIRLWGTYYGGVGEDWGRSCATDALGNVYLTGETSSSTINVIATNGSHQPTFGGGNYDAFLVKFDANGTRQWGTYYGGTGEDYGRSCAAEASGHVYIAGYTNSSNGNVIATPGSHQSSYGAGSGTSDAFAVRFDGNGVRQWGSYYGGSGTDLGSACTTDVLGNLYLAGSTSSNTGTIIATPGSHQPIFGGGITEVFLVKFNANGIRQWSTYYGGAGGEGCNQCVADVLGSIYIIGATTSGVSSVIATPGTYQSVIGGGTDAFIVKFNSNGVRQIGTYYGGIGNDYGFSCSLDATGSLFISGYTNTSSGSAIATAGAHQPAYGGGANEDAFLVKFAACNPPTQPLSINGNTTICSGSGASSYSVATVSGATSYTWSLPAGWSGSSTSNSISASPGSSGVFSVIAGNACGSSVPQTLSVTVNPLPAVTVSTSAQILCEGESATLTASGASTYTFNPGGSGSSIVVTPNVSSTYTVVGVDANGCSNTTLITQNVDACVGITSHSIEQEFSFYPNPTNAKINLELRSAYELRIMNSIGQVVYEVKLNPGKHLLDMETLPKGVYLVNVKNEMYSRTIKVIKE